MEKLLFWPDFNDWWDYGNPAETAVKFQRRLDNPAEGDTQAYRLQLQTQLARTHSLRQQFAKAHALLDAVEAEMESESVVEVRCLLERGRTFNSSGERETAVSLFQRAAEIAQLIGADFYQVDALHMLGIAAPAAEQMGWNQQALAAAQASEDGRAQRWQGSLLNNIGWTFFDQENYAEALRMFEETAVFYAGKREQLKQYHIARWSVAKTLRFGGQAAEALVILRELEAAGNMDGFTAEEIGECLLLLGEGKTAVVYFAQAHEKLAQIAWIKPESNRMQRLKRLAEGGSLP